MYKPTDVFLNSDDSAKIAPYIPKEMLDGWEWRYTRSGCLAYMTHCFPPGASGYMDGSRGTIACVGKNYSEPWPKQYQIPALDVGILGRIFVRLNMRYSVLTGNAIILPDYNVYHERSAESELQNRRDAIMYLIDQKLISPVEGREEL